MADKLNLLWFEGIDWQTPIRNIGWTWLLLAVLIVYLIVTAYQLYRTIRA
jgi:hypothetical protein